MEDYYKAKLLLLSLGKWAENAFRSDKEIIDLANKLKIESKKEVKKKGKDDLFI